MNTKRFENKVAIVTGASRGIGQGIALAFAREGAHVVSVDIGDQTETGTKAKALGAKFNCYTEDFGKLNQQAAKDLIAKIIADTGRVDILVNNAGIIRRAPIVDHPEADWNALLQINLSAPFVPGYTAAKSGIAGITKAFANELAKERCNFNAIAPGYVATENTRPLREDEKRSESILARIPEARWAEPSDIAEPILFLASKDADYMNGTIMNVDGGWLAR